MANARENTLASDSLLAAKGHCELPAESVQQLINRTFESSPLAVFGVDADGRIGYWNSLCAELFELPEDSSIDGLHSSDLLCGSDALCQTRVCSSCAIMQTMQSEKQMKEYTLTVQAASGKPLGVSVSTCYFYQPDPQGISTYFSLKVLDDCSA